MRPTGTDNLDILKRLIDQDDISKDSAKCLIIAFAIATGKKELDGELGELFMANETRFKNLEEFHQQRILVMLADLGFSLNKVEATIEIDSPNSFIERVRNSAETPLLTTGEDITKPLSESATLSSRQISKKYTEQKIGSAVKTACSIM